MKQWSKSLRYGMKRWYILDVGTAMRILVWYEDGIVMTRITARHSIVCLTTKSKAARCNIYRTSTTEY